MSVMSSPLFNIDIHQGYIVSKVEGGYEDLPVET
jgi:hypothetical protein